MPSFHRLVNLLLKPAMLLLVVVFLFACANVVSPTGGPRDEDPPVVLRSIPPNFSPNFEGNEIRIFFDEFVELKNINQKLLVSPPLENQPDIRVRGRSVVISLDEQLRQNTTYNFFFGDAIVDITEGNAIPNFQFVVSTGPFVDSLSLAGRVTDAFSLKPSEGVYVMLYEDIYDSIPYLERPVYLAKTDKEGRYAITNMREGQYKIFALDDANANFKYDLPNERIAFLDSLLTPEYFEPPAPSEAIGEHEHEHEHDHDHDHDHHAIQPGPEEGLLDMEDLSLAAGADSLFAMQPGRRQYLLRMFQEADTLQRIITSGIVRNGLFQMVFRVPFDTIMVNDLAGKLSPEAYLLEPSRQRDTLMMWLLPPVADTLHLEISDRWQVLDTLRFSTRPRETRGRGAAAETQPNLGIRANASRSLALPFFEKLTITASNPVRDIDTTAIVLMTADSLTVIPALFGFEGSARRKLMLQSTLEQDESYIMKILPGAFTDFFEATNDTLRSVFSTTQLENYGLIILNLQVEETPGQFVLQLLDKDGKSLKEKVVKGSGVYEFHHLAAGNYGLRLIHDLNMNGRWDTGHYLRGIQPEPVYLFDDVLQIRQNWESELNWNVNL